MKILQRKKRTALGAMCEVQLDDRNRARDVRFMLCLSKTIDQLAMANSVCRYGYVLREDCHVLRRALNLEIEGERKKGRQNGHLKSRFMEKARRLV